jgi:PAS domain S-box-containing protein
MRSTLANIHLHTEWKRMESRLAARAGQQTFFIEHVPTAIAMFDTKMRYLAVSRSFLSLIEFSGSPAEVIGRSHYETFPDMPAHWRGYHSRVLVGEHMAHAEEVLPRRDGRIDWVRWSMKPWRTADGGIGGALLAGDLITDEVKGRHAVAESEVRFRATFENAAVGIAHLSLDLRWLRANQTLCRIIGWPINELVTKSLQDITHPDDLEVDLAHLQQMRLGKIDNYDMEKRYRRKDGVIIWAKLTVSCVRNGDGSIDYFVAIVEDISARKRAEVSLQRQAELLDQSHDAIFTWKVGGGITYWNRGAEALYGFTAADAMGRCSHELLQTRANIPIHEIEARIAGSGSWYGELTHIARDGREIVVESRHVRVSYDGDTYALETNRDITARKQAEEELRRSEERFRSSVLHSPLPILLYDDREQILAVSQSWLEESGYSREELRRMEDWTTRAHGERSDEALENIRQLILTGREMLRIDVTVSTKDRRERLWNIVAAPLGTLSDGRHLFINVAQDTTERKAHEERVQLLMREAYHRIKNLLGLVQAIARQSADRGAEEFIERFTARIQALGASQDLLVQNQWHGAFLDDLVRAQLSHFADLVGSRITVHGPKLRLNAAAAQATGLALHELATNAGKYGALSTDTGCIDVDWGVDGENFAMSWTERGGPPVRAPDHRGFGTTVIDSMVKHAISGEVQLNYASSGLEWHLTCLAANALEGTARPATKSSNMLSPANLSFRRK